MLDTLDVAPATPEPFVIEAPPAAVAPAPVRWSLATRVAFRFCFLYFGLYVLTTQMLGGLWIVPKLSPPNMGATGWMKSAIAWTANHVFHVKYQFVTTLTGSGDKTIDWIHAFLLVVAAAAVTAVWSGLDRRRPNYVSMHKWNQVFLRFAAGSTMVGYGMVKAIPLQMSAPSFTRLLEPYYNFSPMGVLWASIGASFPYERFAGLMELTAGVLLFVPQLSMLGAMVLIADSVQIFALNMTYDVPVKLFSFHLILIGLVLLAPEMKRLLNVIVLNRSTEPSPVPPLVGNRGIRWTLVAMQIFLGGYMIQSAYAGNMQGWLARGGGAPKSPLYGIYNIEKMTIDGVERAPLVTDYARFRRVMFQFPTAMSFQRMDETFTGYGVAIDTSTKKITVNKAPNQPDGTLAYDQPQPDVLVLDGQISGHKIRMETRRMDHTKFQLLSRPLKFIQERPWNR